MKIALILNSFPEISEKFLLNHIIGLIKSGADIRIFAAHRPQTDKRHDLYLEYDVEKYVRYVDVPRSLKTRFFAAPRLFASLFFRNPKAAIEAVRFGKYRTVAKNMKLLYFGNRFAREQFDVVHCHFGANGLIGVYLKECGFCKKVVTAFHGSDINSYPKKHGLDVYKTLYAKGDLVTSNTNFTKDKIVANGCPAHTIRIVPESLIASEYASIDRSKIIPDSVLTVGRLEEKKGHRYALEAIALVKKEIPGVQYYMAGEGSLMGSLKVYAEELGIAGCCHFVGVCTNSQVKELYSTCAVFTLPSVTASNGDMEGQGLVIQEAQVCGLPVVTTLHNGIPDGLLDDISGYLVPEKDSAALAEKILLLIRDSALREKMGKTGKAFAAGKYDIGPITSNLIGYYNEISK